MTTAVREPRARRAETRAGTARVPAYVLASQRRTRRAVLRGEGPWRRPDRLIAVGGCLLGLAGLVVCSWAAAGEVDLSTQLRWLLGGIVSVAVSSLCLAYSLMSGLRTLRIEVARVLGTVQPAWPTTRAGAAGSGRAVTVTGMRRHHHPDCPLVAGKQVRELTAADIADEGLRPCGACAS